MSSHASWPIVLLGKAQSTGHRHTLTITYIVTQLVSETLSNSCFDRGGCCGQLGVFCLRVANAFSMQIAHDTMRDCTMGLLEVVKEITYIVYKVCVNVKVKK